MERRSEGNEFILKCSCGCGDGFAFRADGGRIYADAFESRFYSDQSPALNRIKTTARLAFSRDRKNRWVVGTVVSSSELRKLREFLAENIESLEDEKERNVSHFNIEYDAVPDLCFLDLMCDLNAADVLLGKYYKCSELVFGRRGTERLIDRIDDALARPMKRGRVRFDG